MKLVVVLGKKLFDDGEMSHELVNRLELGISTFNRENADFICLCGGMPNKYAALTEASQMYAYLMKKGFPENKILIEEKSLTTRGNAKYLKKILEGVEVDRIYLVSSRYHFFRTNFPRCQDIFKKFFKDTEIINTYNNIVEYWD